MIITVDQILSAARECLETPFLHQGRIVGLGLDCAGVLCHVSVRLGLQHDAPLNYSRVPGNGLLERVLDSLAMLVPIPLSELRAGDVLLMRFVRNPQHVAICTGDGVIHAYAGSGKCCEHRLDDNWRRRIVRAYRFAVVA